MKKLEPFDGRYDEGKTVFVDLYKTHDEKMLMIVVVDEIGNILPNGLIATLSPKGIFREAGLDPKYGFSMSKRATSDIGGLRIKDLVLEGNK